MYMDKTSVLRGKSVSLFAITYSQLLFGMITFFIENSAINDLIGQHSRSGGCLCVAVVMRRQDDGACTHIHQSR